MLLGKKFLKLSFIYIFQEKEYFIIVYFHLAIKIQTILVKYIFEPVEKSPPPVLYWNPENSYWTKIAKNLIAGYQ